MSSHIEWRDKNSRCEKIEVMKFEYEQMNDQRLTYHKPIATDTRHPNDKTQYMKHYNISNST